MRGAADDHRADRRCSHDLAGTAAVGDYDPGSALRCTLGTLVALRPRPDVVLFTDDLTEGGEPEEYASVLATKGSTCGWRRSRGTTTGARPSPPRSKAPL
jgi:hypothetical protein